MRSIVGFLLGVVVGVIGMLFMPELTPRREQLNTGLRKQIDALEQQVHEMGNQLKSFNPSKAGDESAKKASPSPSASSH
jgi:gas vesicle protein